MNTVNILNKADSPKSTAAELARPFMAEMIEGQITRVIENTLSDLEALRHGIESAGSKYGLVDVRQHRGVGAAGVAHLRGVEATITYSDLVHLVDTMRSGLARRRVELA